MGNIPTLKPREVVALLEALGFNEVRQRGSHKQFRTLMGDAQLFIISGQAVISFPDITLNKINL